MNKLIISLSIVVGIISLNVNFLNDYAIDLSKEDVYIHADFSSDTLFNSLKKVDIHVLFKRQNGRIRGAGLKDPFGNYRSHIAKGGNRMKLFNVRGNNDKYKIFFVFNADSVREYYPDSTPSFVYDFSSMNYSTPPQKKKFTMLDYDQDGVKEEFFVIEIEGHIFSKKYLKEHLLKRYTVEELQSRKVHIHGHICHPTDGCHVP